MNDFVVVSLDLQSHFSDSFLVAWLQWWGRTRQTQANCEGLLGPPGRISFNSHLQKTTIMSWGRWGTLSGPCFVPPCHGGKTLNHWWTPVVEKSYRVFLAFGKPEGTVRPTSVQLQWLPRQRTLAWEGFGENMEKHWWMCEWIDGWFTDLCHEICWL